MIAVAAVADVALGAPASAAITVAAPLLAFLGAALALASLLERAGLAERAAVELARLARGSVPALYVLACGLCALLTSVISLDGAVVLMIPLLGVLARRLAVPFAPLFLGVVAVANAASIAVPQGNPTNLVVMARLRLSAGAFVAHMAIPGLVAAVICAAGVALSERACLRGRYKPPREPRRRLTGEQHRALGALVLAALVAAAAPVCGVAPWWPFAGAVACGVAISRARPHPAIPWRVAAQVLGLVIVAGGLHAHLAGTGGAAGLPLLVAVAAGVGVVAALANNLPASACAAGLLASGQTAYAAAIGLGVGPLALPQGSVATLLAAQLAGSQAPPLSARRMVPLALCALVAATALLVVAP